MGIRLLLSAVIAVGLSAAAGSAAAQVTDSAELDVTVRFIETISLAPAEPLDFGTATTPTAPATITISPGGSRSTNGGGGLLLLSTSGNTGQAAEFSVSALGGEQFSLAFSHVSPAENYTLSDYRVAGCSVASDTATTTTLGGTGLQTCTLNVGATLSVPAGATGSVDVGQLEATVAYN